MQTQHLTVDATEARALYREYRKHLHYSTPVDREVMRAYQLLAQGRLVIQALASIVKAGVNEQGLPKLAIARADSQRCFLQLYDRGAARMSIREHVSNNARGLYFDFPRGSFPGAQGWRAQSMVPPCPLQYRPKRGLQNYHIMFEAEWTRVVPVDPFLLRRVGKSDLWCVLAAWDLTEVERAVLATRLTQ